MMEKITPAPKEADRAMDEKPSSTDLAKRRWGGLPRPSSMAPKIVIEPMQKSKKAVTKPSAKRSFFDLIRVFRFSPKWLSPFSKSNNSPIMEPRTILNIKSKKFWVFMAKDTPRERVNRPMPWKTISDIRSGNRERTIIPTVPPMRIAPALTRVPKGNIKNGNLRFFNFSCLQARSANFYFSGFAIYNGSYSLNVGAPCSSAYPVRVAYFIAEGSGFTTDLTFCHCYYSFPFLESG